MVFFCVYNYKHGQDVKFHVFQKSATFENVDRHVAILKL